MGSRLPLRFFAPLRASPLLRCHCSGVSETPGEVWELDGNDQEYSLWEHPKIRAINLTTAVNEVYRNVIRQQLEGEVEKDANGDPQEPAFLTDGACPADLKSVYRHLEKEQDSFQRPQYTLRHTFTFSQNYNYAATVIQRAFGNVNNIVTAGQLLSNATIGEPTLDAAMSTTLANVHIYSRPSGVDASSHQQSIDGITHQWGWLKCAPRIISEGRRKVTITQEWKLELWSTWVYSIAS